MLQPGMVMSSKYEILKEIGHGGMSVVYQARDCTTGKLLAVKDVERNSDDGNHVVIQSLAAEGRMLKMLSNPHLPKIYDIIENDNSFMVVMDYIEGISMDRLIAQQGAQPEDRIYQWGMQVCEVFHYLHNQTPPIVYRDMKPANIMVKPDGNLMMIDFGTARTQKVDQVMQSDTICIGTEGFAAPEQFGGIGQSDARTDIFCFGGTLYNLVTGHSPCDKPKGILPLEQWDKRLEKSPLNYIIKKCTRSDPAERYQTAMELYEDLRLASVGAFREPGANSRTGLLLRGGWQRQSLKAADGSSSGSATGSLSGLLRRKSDTATLREEKNNQQNTVHEPAPMMQSPDNNKRAEANTHDPQMQNVAIETSEEADGGIWRKLMLISGFVTVFLLLAGVLILLLGSEIISYAMFVLALGSLILMVYSLIAMQKQ